MKLLLLLFQLAPFISGFLIAPNRAKGTLRRLQSSTNVLQRRNYCQEKGDSAKPSTTTQKTKHKLRWVIILETPIVEPSKTSTELEVKPGPIYAISKRVLYSALCLTVAFFFLLLMDLHFAKSTVDELEDAVENFKKVSVDYSVVESHRAPTDDALEEPELTSTHDAVAESERLPSDAYVYSSFKQ